MPKLIAERIASPIVTRGQDAASLVEVGDIENLAMPNPRRFCLRNYRAAHIRLNFQIAVEARKSHLLLIIDHLPS